MFNSCLLLYPFLLLAAALLLVTVRLAYRLFRQPGQAGGEDQGAALLVYLLLLAGLSMTLFLLYVFSHIRGC